MTNALTIKGLEKVYKDGFQALKGIDLTVERGDFFALLGPNGAGKSTTIGIICSLVQKTAGEVSIFGHNIDEDFSSAKRSLGVVPQEVNVSQFEKVMNILIHQAGYFGIPRNEAIPRAEKYLRLLGLWDRKDSVFRSLSGGMKRRVMIARAMMHEPSLLILDEPTAGVDIEIRRSMWAFMKSINEAGTTIILTTHYLDEAESLCRNIAIIDEGKIVENTSMSKLLAKLHKEWFVFDTVNDLPSDFCLGDWPTHVKSSHTVEIEVEKGTPLNTLFEKLTEQGVQVASMRNKSNRLEELFVSLVQAPETEV